MEVRRGAYRRGLPATPVYSAAPQLRHPTTRARIITHRMYAKEVYRVHSAMRLRERWFRVSSCNCAFVIFSDSADRVFSNEAGEASSPW